MGILNRLTCQVIECNFIRTKFVFSFTVNG